MSQSFVIAVMIIEAQDMGQSGAVGSSQAIASKDAGYGWAWDVYREAANCGRRAASPDSAR